MKFLKLFLLLLPCFFVVVSCSGDNSINDNSDWITLFDGQSFSGWQMYGEDPITDRWMIEDGTIVCNKGAGETNKGFRRSLMTDQKFGNFEFEMEYKIAKGGNSGLMYHVVEDTAYNHDYVTGPEYQILDDEFSRSESKANKMVASSYDMYVPAESKKPNPYGEWNKVRLIYNNGHVEHWLNGEKVLEFQEGNEDWKERKAKSKWRNLDVWGASKTGHISLQDHGDEIAFRNIRVKKL